MSTEIKNTLFRFITMRAPEILSKKSKDLGFVFHPDLVNDKISSTSKTFFLNELAKPLESVTDQLFALQLKAKTFTIGLLNTKVDLETLVTTTFYDYSENYSKIKSDTEKSKKNVENIVVTIPIEHLKPNVVITLWDNLFYQLITQKNPSLRDAIMNVLICNHTLDFVKKDIKFLKTSVVIPPSFYGATIEMEKFLKIADTKKVSINSITKENLKNVLKTENYLSLLNNVLKIKSQVQILEKKYRKNESLKINKEQILYNLAIDEAYAKATFTDEKIENKVTGEVRIVRNYVDLKLPKFAYLPNPEIDQSDLEQSLGNKISEIISIDQLKEITSYNEVYELLDELIETYNTNVSEFSKTDQSVAVVAGQIINAPQTLFARSSNTIPYTASLTYTTGIYKNLKNSKNFGQITDGSNPPSTTNNWINFLVAISNIDLSDLVVDSNIFNISELNGTDLFGDITLYANMNTTNNTLVFSDLSDSVFQIPYDISEVRITAKIILKDASILNINTVINVNRPVLTDIFIRVGVGIIVLQPEHSTAGSGNPTPTTTPTTVPEVNSIFVPSRFGVKYLGVADYRKVEQEICCYEPGEVSHIENIMAREYKEKATERIRSTDTTLTKSSESESENLTDTTTTSRNEMHREVSQVIAEDSQFGLQTGFRYGGFSIDASFANNSSQEDSSTQAQTYAQDVTQRAMERVVTKNKSELITKIIESYKENNKHGFDNTKGEENISGVYRFINKVYNNQIVNYGKRAMVEFMIPEPSRFHILASIKNPAEDSIILIDKPVDPRSLAAGVNQIATYKEISKGTKQDNYIYWCSLYGVEAEIPPAPFLSTGVSFTKSQHGGDGGKRDNKASSSDVKVPEGYQLYAAQSIWDCVNGFVIVKVGNKNLSNSEVSMPFSIKNTDKVPISVFFELVW